MSCTTAWWTPGSICGTQHPYSKRTSTALQRVLDIAADADLHRFVFCSTIGTIALGEGRPATEDDAFNWHGVGGPYIESRLKAEELVLRYARERALPAVALNVSNPYGPHDWQPNQGLMVKLAAQGQLPVYVKGVSTEVVGIEDVADAFLLAADHGRVGERYIISESYMPMRELLTTAAQEVGATPPRFGIPLAVMYAAGFLSGVVSRVLQRDPVIDVTGVRLLHTTSPADHGKAARELGWNPRPAAESIRKAARFHVDNAKDVARRQG